MLILDEADEMLKMGFIEDMDFIMSCLIHEHQTLFFAATMPDKINRLVRTYLKEPVRVELNKEQVAPQSLVHHFQYTGPRNRLNALIEYLKREKISQAIIFCNSRHRGENLIKELKGKFKSIGYIHGGLEQSKRTSIFERFRQKKITLMVATDVAGRGLDFSHVSHVINYDYPYGLESYTNRTGRAARMGRPGIAMTFVTDQELRALKSLLKTNRIDPVWHGTIPNLQTVSKPNGRRNGRKYFKKRFRPVPKVNPLTPRPEGRSLPSP
jgi:ATP-dependent RNA helicase DeaD